MGLGFSRLASSLCVSYEANNSEMKKGASLRDLFLVLKFLLFNYEAKRCDNVFCFIITA